MKQEPTVQEQHEAMKSYDEMLTLIWVNNLMVSNRFHDTLYIEMDKPEQYEAWRAFVRKLKG